MSPSRRSSTSSSRSGSSRSGATPALSADRRGHDVELAPGDLAALTGAAFAPIARDAS